MHIENQNHTLSPKLDVIFQALFGEVGCENITKRFLESILDLKIENIDLSKNSILRRKHISDKLSILDVITKINDDENCNIEMQMLLKIELLNVYTIIGDALM